MKANMHVIKSTFNSLFLYTFWTVSRPKFGSRPIGSEPLH